MQKLADVPRHAPLSILYVVYLGGAQKQRLSSVLSLASTASEPRFTNTLGNEMILSELQDIDYRYDKLKEYGTATRQREEMAGSYFGPVLRQLIDVLREKEKPVRKQHTIADNYPLGGIGLCEPCPSCEEAHVENEQLQADNEGFQSKIDLALKELAHIEGEKNPTEKRVYEALKKP